MKIDLLCPVENQGIVVKTNTQTEEPYALLKLFNLSENVVTKVALVLSAYDGFGKELGVIRAEFEDLEGQPKEFFAETKAISLAEFPETKHVTVEILEVDFAEGESYIKEGENADYNVTEADDAAQVLLSVAAGDDAVCYAKEEGTHWVCVCGRPNANEAEECVRCGREKDTVLELFGSFEALNQTLEEQEELERQAEEEFLQAKAMAKAARIKKVKKTALTVGIVLCAAAILALLVNFAYSGIRTLMGNSAAKNGDYLTAYSHYAAVNNQKKIATVSEKVLGNTGSNLWQAGMMTADEENLYYIDNDCNIYKESKATGEKTQLGDAVGLYLNVSDGWVYYLDAVTGQGLCRIGTDGATKEVVYDLSGTEKYFMSLSVVGNELYFNVQEPRTDMTPAEQEAMMMTGQGNPYAQHLYRLTVGKTEPVLVSEENVAQFICYEGKIYYINMEDDNAVYSMNRKGKSVKKVVSGPVSSFELKDDLLYYVDGTTNEETGMPNLNLLAMDLEGDHQEVLIDDKMILAFAPYKENLCFVNYSTEGIDLYYYENGQSYSMVPGCQQFNSIDGYLMYIDMEGNFVKSKFDKDGFETIGTTQSESIVAE